MKFSETAQAKHRPVRSVTLQPSDFADRWSKRPDTAVAVGLRLLSEAAEGEARKQASEIAVAQYEDSGDVTAATDEYNDALLASLVGSALCDPNDVNKFPEHLPFADDMVRSALTRGAIQRLFHELERLVVEVSQAHPEADDEELERVRDMLHPALLVTLEPSEHRRVRRFARFILEHLAVVD